MAEKNLQGINDQEFRKYLYWPNYNGPDGMWCVGINVLHFDLQADTGRDGQFARPTHDQLRHFHNQGANCFRLAITWERLQARLGAPDLDPVPGVEEVVDFITQELGGYVILDPHNRPQGMTYNSVNATRSDFFALWRAIAKKWGRQKKAIFGLYNEPRSGFEDGTPDFFRPERPDLDGRMVEAWRQWAQGAIDAIRSTGATNLILVPGLHGSDCTEWTGAERWGKAIDDRSHAGNTRLAALQDPAMHLAYDVRQFLHRKHHMTGCDMHESNDGHGADWGLDRSIDWAKQYGKKLMMTEIRSSPDGPSTVKLCKSRLHSYLQKMNDSGVFLGYLVWQFGCDKCGSDLWEQRPSNLDWYRWAEFGWKGQQSGGLTNELEPERETLMSEGGGDADEAAADATDGGAGALVPGCSKSGEDCSTTKCCVDDKDRCYAENATHARCKSSCQGGQRSARLGGRTTAHAEQQQRACRDVGCYGPMQDCRGSRCCSAGLTCFEKDNLWATCMASCEPSQDWTCRPITAGCSFTGSDCRETRCCIDPAERCYVRDANFAACRSSCKPNPTVHLGGVETKMGGPQTAWNCSVLPSERNVGFGPDHLDVVNLDEDW